MRGSARWLWPAAVGLGLGLAALAVTRLTCFGPVDPPGLAGHVQLCWSVAHGHGFTQTVLPDQRGGLFGFEPFMPGLVILAPLQWAWPGSGVLAVLQAMAWALGAIPVVRLARGSGGHAVWGLVAMLLFGIHPLCLRPALVDFHPAILAVPCLLWMLEFQRQQRPGAAVFVGFLACALHEDAALLVLLLAPLSAFFAGQGLEGDARVRTRRVRAWGAALPLAVGGTWLVLLLAVHREWAFLGSRLDPPASWLTDLAGQLRRDLPGWLRPVPWSAFAAPEAYLAPVVALLGTCRSWREEGGMGLASDDGSLHHVAVVGPLVVLAMCIGAARLGRVVRVPPSRAGWLAALVVLTSLLTLPTAPEARAFPWFQGGTDGLRARRSLDVERQDLVRAVPPDAPLLVDPTWVHLAADRPRVWFLDEGENTLYRQAWQGSARYALVGEDRLPVVLGMGPALLVAEDCAKGAQDEAGGGASAGDPAGVPPCWDPGEARGAWSEVRRAAGLVLLAR